MFGLKKAAALPKESQGTPRSSRFCRCGTKIVYCRQCGAPYCPRCDQAHLLMVEEWDQCVLVWMCQAGGVSWR